MLTVPSLPSRLAMLVVKVLNTKYMQAQSLSSQAHLKLPEGGGKKIYSCNEGAAAPHAEGSSWIVDLRAVCTLGTSTHQDFVKKLRGPQGASRGV